MLKRKSTVTQYRPLIYIGYKHNAYIVLCFVSKEDAGKRNYYITYIYKQPDTFANVSINTVSHSPVMSKFFGYINEVDSHNKFRQSDLSL